MDSHHHIDLMRKKAQSAIGERKSSLQQESESPVCNRRVLYAVNNLDKIIQ